MTLTYKMRAAAGLAVLLASAACDSLNVSNPNAPDATRALADPNGVQAVAGGTLRTWFNTTNAMNATGVLVTMADSYSASWNNFNMRLYSSGGIGDPSGAKRTAWGNDPADAARTSIETYWYGYYAGLSSANDVLRAIRAGKLVIGDAANTKMVETIGVLAQGMMLSSIAMNYDQGFIVDETTDLASLQFSAREKVRDAALAKLAEAATLAGANAFSTPASWTNGTSYSNVEIQKLANTFAARTIAYYPRNSTENTAADWAKVATLAANGISNGGKAFQFTGDGCINYCDELKLWSNDLTTMRVDTRVANLMDPVTQKHPWPDPTGNPKPNSADKRLGNGDNGTDFRWNSDQIFRPARGQYHQSEIAHIRYEEASFNDPNGTGGGYGIDPVISKAENDLLWAEALIRTNGSLATAASLINNTRVTRGGLPAATAADGAAGLLTKLQYEQEIELMGLGPQPYYNRRRIDGLQAQTPRQMPVPSKELGVLQKEVYTFGGDANPSGMNRVTDGSVETVVTIWDRMYASHSRTRSHN
ncbi:MAG: hypothetical protein JWO05_1225 [Gemmatimonadetes bacterium]|nr:hypothetical protein [Gemmatimonadota bacterium]